jgi:hypothetical protein
MTTLRNGTTMTVFRRNLQAVRPTWLVAALIGIAISRPVAAQWSTTHEQFYAQASHNWQFRRNYPGADRLFNAFDYGHAILFEEAAIEVQYAKLVPEAKVMFDWAHVLHRQVYDVWADERLSVEQKNAELKRLLAYYLSRRDIAFSTRPKDMDLMEGQPYSLAFRRQFPKFNGLIWAYHWLQVGLYEPLVTGQSEAERQAGIAAAVARFWEMLEDPPKSMPRVMPMTAAIAPEFSRRYPEIAIIFDNLHGMHDVISDILADSTVPKSRKRAEILRAAARYRDDTTSVMSVAEWRSMAEEMGIDAQGGRVIQPDSILAPKQPDDQPSSPSVSPFRTSDQLISIDLSSESRTEQYFMTASSIARSVFGRSIPSPSTTYRR